MYIKSEVELIYKGQGVEENGSPTSLEISKVVQCNEAETFSVNFYNEQQRNMRLSRNLVIPTYLTKDIEEDGKRYELMYCRYDGLLYKVHNILKVRNTRRVMMLDIQEVR